MRVNATGLGVWEADRRVALERAVTRGWAGEAIRLPGLVFPVRDRVWNATPPEPRTMGFLETINPLDEGSVWAWLTNSARYRHCVEERRAAKSWFGAGAMPKKSGRHSRHAAGGGQSTVTNTGLE